MEQPHIVIHADRCVGCGLCSQICVAHNLVIRQNKAAAVRGCILCGQCSAVCPQNAITLEGCGSGQVEKTADVRLAPQDVLDVIRFRRSIRKFKTDPIPPEVLRQVLEAGRLTHTAKNLQDVSYVVLAAEKDRLEQMAVKLFRTLLPFAGLFSPLARGRTIDDHFFFFNAPAVIVILAKDKTNGILAAQNMEFVAEACGLGVLYSGFFTMAANASGRIRKALGIPKGKKVAMTLVLGYPDVKFLRSTPHRELDVRYL